MILEAVAELLRSDPGAPLTMARAAEAVGASPMSLYRYFSDRDDLVVSLTRHVLHDAGAGVPEDAPWQDRLSGWMTTVYREAVAHPQLFQLAAQGESPAWLTCSARLATILERAGFEDEADLARAVFLVGTITLGQAMVAVASGTELSLPTLYRATGNLTTDEVHQVVPLLPHFVDVASQGFDVIVAWTVAALTDMAGGRRRRLRAARART